MPVSPWPAAPGVVALGLIDHVIVHGNQQRKTFRGDDHKAYLDRLEHYRTLPHQVSEVAKLLRRDQANVSMMLSRGSAREGRLIV
jgi:hypothetical protein